MDRQRIYAILISGSLAAFGIIGLTVISDQFLDESSQHPAETFEGFMALILITGICIITFVYHLIAGVIEIVGYLRGSNVHTKMTK